MMGNIAPLNENDRATVVSVGQEMSEQERGARTDKTVECKLDARLKHMSDACRVGMAENDAPGPLRPFCPPHRLLRLRLSMNPYFYAQKRTSDESRRASGWSDCGLTQFNLIGGA